ncbi:4921_t:CDS:2 [Funneliformis caledonium]|uniref:4921_t:CDS:1 n=1 Tax=Funneliformis caledonium TaxID=1117310 RepID=A0A9N8ZTB4_9GLOM|nr:4921_t:CDS:2 [Funneliformis caledonium]
MEHFELKTDRKPKLSDNILELKFMQRQQEKALREKLERERSRALGESQWIAFYDELEVGKPYLSFATPEVGNGRLSFGRSKKVNKKRAPTNITTIEESNGSSSRSSIKRANSIQVNNKRKYEYIQDTTLKNSKRTYELEDKTLSKNSKYELELGEIEEDFEALEKFEKVEELEKLEELGEELEEGEIPQKITKLDNSEFKRRSIGFLKPPE